MNFEAISTCVVGKNDNAIMPGTTREMREPKFVVIAPLPGLYAVSKYPR